MSYWLKQALARNDERIKQMPEWMVRQGHEEAERQRQQWLSQGLTPEDATTWIVPIPRWQRDYNLYECWVAERRWRIHRNRKRVSV